MRRGSAFATASGSGTQDVPDVGVPTWKFIWGLIRFRPWHFLFNNLALTGRMLGLLMMGLITREFFNLLTGEADAGFTLPTLIALILVSAVGRMGGFWGTVRMNRPFTYHNHTLLHKNLMERILERPGARALPESPGEAISRFRGDVGELPLFALWINDLLGNAVFTVIAVALMLSINPWITLVSFGPLVLIVIAANSATSRIQAYRQATRRASGKVTGFIAETFGAVQAIKVARSEDHIIDRFDILNERRRQAALKDRLFNELLASIFQNSGNLGISIVLLLAAQSLQAGAFTVGDFALFVSYLQTVTGFVSFIGFVWARYKQAGVAVGRMVRLLQGAPPEMLVKPGPVYLDGHLPDIPYIAKTAADRLETLTVSGLSFQYPDSTRGIENINLTLKRGAFTVVTGRIGSGKTTLLRVLLGLLPQDSGEIRWNGQKVDQPSTFFVPPRSAYTAQVPRLFSDTLRENLLLGLPEGQVDLSRAIHAAVMEQDLEELEHDLDTLIGPKGVKLSGGQNQRSAAARMFAREPELFVFDDLSSALDVETERTLWERLFARPATPTCLVVSHRRTALRRADHIIVLKNGRVEAEGQLADLLERSEEMRRLWEGDVGQSNGSG
ncbi:MAG: ABC transporter ATP-binding protein [Anaerolineae bacterium]|nr:ABC transporter ATP-binding protein [Anaerolineae bacterium]